MIFLHLSFFIYLPLPLSLPPRSLLSPPPLSSCHDIFSSLAGPANQDYIPITRIVGFNPFLPAMAACGTFPTTEDNIFPTLAEPDEFFIVTLRSSDNADVIERESRAHVVIHDNDGRYSAAPLRNTIDTITSM